MVFQPTLTHLITWNSYEGDRMDKPTVTVGEEISA